MADVPAGLRPRVQDALGATGCRKPTMGSREPPRTQPGASQADLAGLWEWAWKVSGEKTTGFGFTREYRFAPRRKWRFDWGNGVCKVAVEVDGGQWKARGGRHASDEDRWKMAEAMARGWAVFRYSPAQLRKDPGRCVALVVRALAGRMR